VLAGRLRSLESAGLIQKRRLPPPAPSTVYELTELGSGLRPALFDLFHWGLQLIGTPTGNDTIKASYWLPAIQATARLDLVPQNDADVYELRVGDEIITVTIKGGNIDVRQGSSESPDLVIETDQETFAMLGLRRMSPDEALESGKLSFEGDPAVAERCASVFGLASADRASISS
jgi:hypothetical protein